MVEVWLDFEWLLCC